MSDNLEQRSRELFDERVAGLDGRTRSRLNQARQAALEVARQRERAPALRWLMPVGSAAAVALVGLLSWQLMRPDVQAPESTLAASVDDLEIITSDADLELLQNMAFYAWLDAQPEVADLGEDG